VDQKPPPDDADLDNPYAPPQSAFAAAETTARPEFVEIPFAVGPIFNWTWALFKDYMWPCIFIVWGAMVLNYAVSFAGQALQASVMAANQGPAPVRLLSLLLFAVTLVIQTWLGIGMNLGLLKIARQEPVSFGVLFTGGRYLVTTILAGICVGAIMFVTVIVPASFLGMLAAALAGRSTAGVSVVVIGCAAFAVLALYQLARLAQFYYLVIDQNCGVFDSIRLSWQWTQNRAGIIVVIYLLQLVLVIAGFLALCVGLIFTMPLSSLLLVVTYLALAGAQKPVAPSSPFEQFWPEEL
jgi:uncharacterized membrane protein